MNNVPVLDQGMHGTCTTFAVTAALDAIYSTSDYISQLCHLELGKYLEKQDPKYKSGWDGASIAHVLTQIKTYGIISKDYQIKNGCAGVFKYPNINSFRPANQCQQQSLLYIVKQLLMT